MEEHVTGSQGEQNRLGASSVQLLELAFVVTQAPGKLVLALPIGRHWRFACTLVSVVSITSRLSWQRGAVQT